MSKYVKYKGRIYKSIDNNYPGIGNPDGASYELLAKAEALSRQNILKELKNICGRFFEVKSVRTSQNSNATVYTVGLNKSAKDLVKKYYLGQKKIVEDLLRESKSGKFIKGGAFSPVQKSMYGLKEFYSEIGEEIKNAAIKIDKYDQKYHGSVIVKLDDFKNYLNMFSLGRLEREIGSIVEKIKKYNIKTGINIAKTNLISSLKGLQLQSGDIGYSYKILDKSGFDSRMKGLGIYIQGATTNSESGGAVENMTVELGGISGQATYVDFNVSLRYKSGGNNTFIISSVIVKV